MTECVQICAGRMRIGRTAGDLRGPTTTHAFWPQEVAGLRSIRSTLAYDHRAVVSASGTKCENGELCRDFFQPSVLGKSRAYRQTIHRFCKSITAHKQPIPTLEVSLKDIFVGKRGESETTGEDVLGRMRHPLDQPARSTLSDLGGNRVLASKLFEVPIAQPKRCRISDMCQYKAIGLTADACQCRSQPQVWTKPAPQGVDIAV